MAAKSKTAANKKPKPLSIRHQRFCEGIVAGMSQTSAYLYAGYEVPRLDARVAACILIAKPNIKARIAELRKTSVSDALMTRDEKRRIAAEIARDEDAAMVDRLRAVAEDAKLAGHYEPEKVTIETGDNTLEALQKRAETVVSGLNRFLGKK